MIYDLAYIHKKKCIVTIEIIDYMNKNIVVANERFSFDDILILRNSGLKDCKNSFIYEFDMLSIDDEFYMVVFRDGAFITVNEEDREVDYLREIDSNIIEILEDNRVEFLDKFVFKR